MDLSTAPIFECDFELDTCGFVQVAKGWGSNFDTDDWERHANATPGSLGKSGPTGDHTTGSGTKKRSKCIFMIM